MCVEPWRNRLQLAAQEEQLGCQLRSETQRDDWWRDTHAKSCGPVGSATTFGSTIAS